MAITWELDVIVKTSLTAKSVWITMENTDVPGEMRSLETPLMPIDDTDWEAHLQSVHGTKPVAWAAGTAMSSTLRDLYLTRYEVRDADVSTMDNTALRNHVEAMTLLLNKAVTILVKEMKS